MILTIIFIGALLLGGSRSSCNCNKSDDNEEDCDPCTDPTCLSYWIYGPGPNRDEEKLSKKLNKILLNYN